jgi:hypothetical protein
LAAAPPSSDRVIAAVKSLFMVSFLPRSPERVLTLQQPKPHELDLNAIYLRRSADRGPPRRQTAPYLPFDGDDDRGALRWARLHADIVGRFGRFAHHNPELDRANIREEDEVLRNGDFAG